MAEGKSRQQWEQTASIMWLLAEPNRDRDRRRQPYTPATFFPFTTEGQKPAGREINRSTMRRVAKSIVGKEPPLIF